MTMRLMDPISHLGPWTVTPSRFIWLFVLANGLLFHAPLWRYLQTHLDLTSSLGVGVLAVLTGLLITLSWLLLGVVSLISPGALLPVVAVWMLSNSVALYAMNTYKVVLDKTMMGNVWSTNRGEAAALFHPMALMYLGVASGLVWWLGRKLRWRAEPRWRRALHLFAATVFGAALVFSQSGAWLWVDKHAKVLGGLLLPWSYTLNSVRVWAEQRDAQRELAPLPALAWDAAPANGPVPVTVVLVIGESARAGNFALYGYGRQTNPLLSQRPVLVLPGARACATYTRRALECKLSHDPQASGLTHETLPDYLARSGQVDVVWRTRNWGEPRLRHVQAQRSSELSVLCRQLRCPEPDQDETLLLGLDQLIAQARHDRQFIVLHQSGSHGPAYHAKYPASFARFAPVCESVDLKACSPASLVNAYDNSIVYTDHFLDRLIAMLERQTRRRTLMLYVSDHGESLGEGGWYLHGAPELVAPREQLDIPFLLWMSPGFGQSLPLGGVAYPGSSAAGPVQAPAAQRGPYGHSHVFHTVLGALGARTDVYRPEFDVLSPWRPAP